MPSTFLMKYIIKSSSYLNSIRFNGKALFQEADCYFLNQQWCKITISQQEYTSQYSQLENLLLVLCLSTWVLNQLLNATSWHMFPAVVESHSWRGCLEITRWNRRSWSGLRLHKEANDNNNLQGVVFVVCIWGVIMDNDFMEFVFPCLIIYWHWKHFTISLSSGGYSTWSVWVVYHKRFLFLFLHLTTLFSQAWGGRSFGFIV